MNDKIKFSDLKLRDIVDLESGDYSIATVIKIEEENKRVKLFRPYVRTSDFSYTSGVIPYIGIEEFFASRNDREVTLVRRERKPK